MRRKADIRKICINIVLFLSVLCTFLLLGYPFFKFIVYAGDKKVRNKRNWFGLKHAQINHPRNGYEDKYEEGRAWCQLSYESGVMKDRYIISGHTPTRTIPDNHGRDLLYRNSNHIVIDCGCTFGGKLSCLCLEDNKEYYI